MAKDYYTTSEVSEMTGVSKERCLQFARKHELEKIRVIDTVWWYAWSESDIELLKSRIGKFGRIKKLT